ncbi:MAG: FAD-dependent oxidoreductase [Candidatus Aenigmarchaeota archaeon]|nr:FAD-dependent oxidoreductase [Candidatus Aenigmarchaeota archaeon]
MHDVIVVGGGAAGLTAAIYACRKRLRTLVVTLDIGGQTNLTEHIENYPGYTQKSGPGLMKTFEEQAKAFGTEFVFGKAQKLEKKDKSFLLTLTNGEKYDGKTVILAYGKVPRTLGIPGEEMYLGRGVSTCATCDMPLFKGKNVAVIGGGNSALEAAELGTKFAKKVYLVHRRDGFRADEITVDKVKSASNVELVLFSVPAEIKGDKFLRHLTVENVNTKKRRTLDVDGVFVEIGYAIDTDFVKHLVELNKEREIIVNDVGETSCPGIFACGDVTQILYKQTVIAAGEGAKAGLSAYAYLQRMEGKPVVKLDWA